MPVKGLVPPRGSPGERRAAAAERQDPGADLPPSPTPFIPPLPVPGLTVWEALLALSGGNARGDGGPVPAPARETPAPVPGEDCSERPLSPALPAESRGGERGGQPAPPTVLLQAEAIKN